jgi:MFS family permease
VPASLGGAGTSAPRSALAGGSILVVVGIAVAGAAGTIPLVVLALASAGIGIGAGQTGATGVLLQAVAPERIVTAMVLWSQLGIVGYLAGPLLGGMVAEAIGFHAIGAVPATVALVVLAAFRSTAWHRPA